MSDVARYLPELWLRIGEHILLAGISTLIAIAIAIPLGILAIRKSYIRGLILASVSILQTIPSLAMLAFLLVLIGKIGVVPAVVALTLYALLPIVRNTVTGLDGVPSEVRQASLGIGMTPWQQLFLVELPLAKDVIIAGIRTAAVIGVGIATLSAFIGAGGLGQFINRGLALLSTELILLGAIPAAALALTVDGSIQAMSWGLQRRPQIKASLRPLLPILRIVAIAAPALLLAIGATAYMTGTSSGSASNGASSTTIRISSKNFTEQHILAEIMAQIIEARTDISVDRRTGLGGTMIVHQALVQGEIDIYAEYSGTALTAILNLPVVSNPDEAFEIVARAYDDQFDLIWMPPFGFTNTFAVCVRRADAEANGWQAVSDVSPQYEFRAGFGPEFADRPDGLPGLLATYPNINIRSILDIDPSLMYGAIARSEVDVIAAFSTDGRIDAFDLVTLDDDRGFFPPYYPSPVVRRELLEEHPEIGAALSEVGGLISNEIMRDMNYRVDEEGFSPAEIARTFLIENGLVTQE